MDLEQIGENYESCHPGLFIGGCYVSYPRQEPEQLYHGTNLESLSKGDWSLRLRLASPANPEGVWLRLPDYSPLNGWMPGEVEMALQALSADSPRDCTLLEARCIIPELQESAEQYEDLEQLIRDGNDLGYVLDEQGQGMPHFMERFAAALEFEHCRDLRLALDISQNLHCYEWVPRDGLKDFGRRKLLEAGVSEELLDSGCIDLEGYGADLLEEAGYVLTADESAYITRNNLEFLRDWSAPEEAGLSMEQQ